MFIFVRVVVVVCLSFYPISPVLTLLCLIWSNQSCMVGVQAVDGPHVFYHCFNCVKVYLNIITSYWSWICPTKWMSCLISFRLSALFLLRFSFFLLTFLLFFEFTLLDYYPDFTELQTNILFKYKQLIWYIVTQIYHKSLIYSFIFHYFNFFSFLWRQVTVSFSTKVYLFFSFPSMRTFWPWFKWTQYVRLINSPCPIESSFSHQPHWHEGSPPF